MKNFINVMIVEDQILHKELFEIYLRNSDKYKVVCTTDNAALADIYLVHNKIDFILMDICTAMGESGLDASARIKKKHPDIKIMIITSMLDYTFIARAREIGVDSFWYKEAGARELLEVMDMTMEGKSVYPNTIYEAKFGNIKNKDLSKVELEILRLIVKGRTNEEISDELSYSKNTVRKYIKNIFDKTGYKNRTELAVKAVEKNIVFNNGDE